MFNISITHVASGEMGEFEVKITTHPDNRYVTTQTCGYETTSERREAFDKALSYARGFEDGVRAVRNHIDARINADDLVQLANRGLA